MAFLAGPVDFDVQAQQDQPPERTAAIRATLNANLANHVLHTRRSGDHPSPRTPADSAHYNTQYVVPAISDGSMIIGKYDYATLRSERVMRRNRLMASGKPIATGPARRTGNGGDGSDEEA